MQIKMRSDGSFASNIGEVYIRNQFQDTMFSIIYFTIREISYLFNIFPTNTNSSFYDEWMTFEYLSTGQKT